MIVSWNWLKEYVRLDMSAEVLSERLMMAGLNLESVSDVEGDIAIDLEVTSNRPDCLGHIGIAREAAALFAHSLQIPAANPKTSGPDAATLTAVENHVPDLCPQYIARVIRGVTIGPSPAWMQRRLNTLGIRPINNVVDCTNYVLMECGQPQHAFDFDRLGGKKIVVRRAAAGESIVAIDQRSYPLQPSLCVIADATHPVAVAGVMGGLETEIGASTRNVLLETAEFSSMSIRATARKLGLHSDSSHRFERGVDRLNLDWASRRCAELILQTAGGELCTGSVFAGVKPDPSRPSVTLRFSQVQRILGIDIPPEEIRRILAALGLQSSGAESRESCTVSVPSWRRDLTREIDLIEEAARVHGYDKIPENADVPLAVSTSPLRDRCLDRVTRTLTGAGFFEALTISFTTAEHAKTFTPWTTNTPLTVDHSSRRHENVLRQSLVPSLLAVRRQNERHGVFNAELFETARVFLAIRPGDPTAEPTLLALVSGRSSVELKGVLTEIVDSVSHDAVLDAEPVDAPWFAPGRGALLKLNGEPFGWMGEISRPVCEAFELQDPVLAAEVDLQMLERVTVLWPTASPLPQFPAMARDLNLVLDEPISWRELNEVVRGAAGPLLDDVEFVDQYRGQQIAAGKKSYVFRMQFRSADRTLQTGEVDTAVAQVLSACQTRLNAVQR